MKDIYPKAVAIAAILKERHETLAVVESSVGGLISAAFTAVPGASAFYLGGAAIYTHESRAAFLDLPKSALGQVRPASEAYALLLGRALRRKLPAAWVVAETGASGPTGNAYGDGAGHACLAVIGPIGGRESERAITLETGKSDRQANMRLFAAAALDLFAECLK